MVNNTTAHLALPLPDLSNQQDEDVPRIGQALAKLDTHAQTVDAAIQDCRSAINFCDETLRNDIEAEARNRLEGDKSLQAAITAEANTRAKALEEIGSNTAKPDEKGGLFLATQEQAEAGTEGGAYAMTPLRTVQSFNAQVAKISSTTAEVKKIPVANTYGKLSIGWIPSLFVGKIELLPFSPEELSQFCNGWHFCNGDRYALDSDVGMALNALPTDYKNRWGIAVNDGSISIPNLYHSDGRGLFLRAVNGTTRFVGSVELDAFASHTHTYERPGYNAGSGGQYPLCPTTYSVSGTSAAGGAETRPINIGMTPAIFLEV